jgi:hypothetical protein
MKKPIKKRPFDQCQCPNCCRDRRRLRRFAEHDPQNLRLTEQERQARKQASNRLGKALNLLGHHVREVLGDSELHNAQTMQSLAGKLIALAREAAAAAESLRSSMR